MNSVLETSVQPASGLVVDVVSDLICPWCFIGKRRIEKAGAILGREIKTFWLPFQLNPDMPIDGLDRRVYRSKKFGSWEQSQRLDAGVKAAGAEVGIAFRHDLMKRTPNTFRGHVLLAAALREGVDAQTRVAERLFQGYFTQGEDVGDPATLVRIATDFRVKGISNIGDLDNPELVAEVKARERQVAGTGIRGVPQISFRGEVLANGAQSEDMLAAAIGTIQSAAENCENGLCTVA